MPCLGKETIGEEELIDKKVWPKEDLDSDSEVKSKRKLLEGLSGDQLVSLQQSFPQLPVSERNQRKRQKSYKKGETNLRGVYAYLPEGSSIEKTSKVMATLRIAGLPAAKLNKPDIANFETPRRCPLCFGPLRLSEQLTDKTVNAAIVERIRNHAESSKRKLTGEKLIQKNSNDRGKKSSKANLVKVCRIKLPERKELVSSPRKKSRDNEGDNPSGKDSQISKKEKPRQ